jgi:hypothetical protein
MMYDYYEELAGESLAGLPMQERLSKADEEGLIYWPLKRDDNLPLACGKDHVAAFAQLGWIPDRKRRGRGAHLLLSKPGMRATLSIPDVREVKRTIIAAQIRLACVSEDQYLRAFHKK